MAVESPRLGLVQRRTLCEAPRKIGIGNEELAERHSIGLALCESLVGSLEGELLVDDVDAPELALEIWTKPLSGGAVAVGLFNRSDKEMPMTLDLRQLGLSQNAHLRDLWLGKDVQAVVDPDLRVHGTQNLWVADASVMPDLISGNTNAVCMMIGAKLGKQLASRKT